ncbi:MAG TPA: serine/threonine-protein kinase [Pyrinomonadaceae bacterium]|nr:serine/threonine-protein kinase [Pyrinomonadaceae bacterium]
MTNTLRCPQCQQPHRAEAKFCDTCGFALESNPVKTLPLDPSRIPGALTQTDSFIGRIIESRYQIIELLGEGAIGRVYRAQHLLIERKVAIKFLHKKYVTDETALKRFQREAYAAASIKHHNVVEIYDFHGPEAEDVSAYIVMELVGGQSLRALLEAEGRLPITRAVALMCEICKGVGAAHRQEVIHRDIKPENVIVGLDEEGSETVKVLDFGLAKLRETNEPGITLPGILLGTLLYMSPEQCRGEALDARSDVYSLSTVLYEMITGAAPFDGADSIWNKHQEAPPPAFPEELDVPIELQAIIFRGLAKSADERPRGATEFLSELQGAVTRQVAKPNEQTPPKKRKFKSSSISVRLHGVNHPDALTLPGRFDFGVITVNPEEIDPVREVLELKTRHPFQSARGHIYYWGAVRTLEGDLAYVVHGATGGNKRDASELVREMAHRFDPDFMLVLGTAVGLQTGNRKMGQVVYSRLVRSSGNRGYVRPNLEEFEEARNLPPDESLIGLADRVAHVNEWQRALRGNKRTIRPPDHKSLSSIAAVKTEIFSGPDGYEDFDAPLFRALRQYCPRVTTVSLEGAATLLSALLQIVQQGRTMGYLVINGIADLVDDVASATERRKRNQDWARYASGASAAFARSLIERWGRDARRHTNIPAKYTQDLVGPVLLNDRALVVHHLHPEKYSELCRKYSDANTRKVFTVCAFEPMYFIRKLQEVCLRPLELEEKEFLEIADGVFPHFAAFRELANQGIEVTRIVLAEDSYEHWNERNKEALELFVRLNGSVDCYVSEVLRLRNDHNLYHMTDHVVFNSSLLLDYYHESQTLIMTYEERGPMHDEFTKFENHFRDNKHAEKLYRPLNHLARPVTPS